MVHEQPFRPKKFRACWQGVEKQPAWAGHGWPAADHAPQALDPAKPSPGVYRTRRV